MECCLVWTADQKDRDLSLFARLSVSISTEVRKKRRNLCAPPPSHGVSQADLFRPGQDFAYRLPGLPDKFLGFVGAWVSRRLDATVSSS